MNPTLLLQVRRGSDEYSRPFLTPFGQRPLVYADFTASGRPLSFFEKEIQEEILPSYGNTHSEASRVGQVCTSEREKARQTIRRAVGADERYAVIFTGSGSTAAVAKLLQMLGISISPALEERYGLSRFVPLSMRPVVFVSAYEHHSNLLPWRESLGEVVEVGVDEHGRVSPEKLRGLLNDYAGRPVIGTFSAASNVTGVKSDITTLCRMIRDAGGLCFADYASAAPHMQPRIAADGLDAAFFSPHKFPGGPSTPGVLIVRRELCCSRPSFPGGGTVEWVSRAGHEYIKDVETREEAGTPDIVGAVRAGKAFALQQSMGAGVIALIENGQREEIEQALAGHPDVRLVAKDMPDRLPIIPLEFRMGRQRLHYNFIVKLLNDLFGIQARGGCLCAGPYLRRLMNECREDFCERVGDQPGKPGVVRISLCYSMKPEELAYLKAALLVVASDGWRLLPEYEFVPKSGEWIHRGPARSTSGDLIVAARQILRAGPRVVVEQRGEGFAASLDAVDHWSAQTASGR